ncbi:MAG: DUF3299 domain-containing protein [Gammaproteobacteria bacterium]|nr:DUF3299 domain-containing protein [Gammaproteobacteria bacterium]
MNRVRYLVRQNLALCLLLFCAAGIAAPASKPIVEKSVKMAPAKPKTIEWTALMPSSDQKALQLAPPISHNIVMDFDENGELKWELPEVYSSAKTVPTMHGQYIKIAGFIVPIEMDEKHIYEFFLVPYFGACIHVPPPPPNQIIYVRYPQGLTAAEIIDPFWVVGTLQIEKVAKGIAASSYTLKADKVYIYK